MSRTLRCLEFLAASSLYEEMSNDHRKEVFLSAGGPQCGKVWSDIPHNYNDFFDNDHFRMGVDIRLGSVKVPDGAVCMMPKTGDNERCLTAMCNPVTHPLLCKKGPARQRPHRSVCHTLTRILRKNGAHVDMERAVPQLYMLESGTGRITEAILDVVSSFPGSFRQCMVDVTVRAPHAERYENSHILPGVAAAAGEQEKLERYGSLVTPLSFESYGRLGVNSARALRTLAYVAASRGGHDPGMSPARLYSQWRGMLERTLTFEIADNFLLAGGSG
eukprot:2636875-Karenia_brevis.AAC.1